MAQLTGTYVTSKLAATIQDQPDVSHNGGRTRVVADKMPSQDPATGDTIWMARLPSNVVLLGSGELHHDGFGAGVTLEIGTFNARGVADVQNSINDSIDASAAGSARILGNPQDDVGKRLWEYTGATEDMGGEIDVQATFVGSDPSAGDASWELYYTID